jgi:monofunctional biosynthetic peptidoglycan transglycosylase
MIHLDPISALRRARRVIASLGGGEAARLASLARPYFKPGAAAARLARLFIRAVIACHAAFFIIMAFACLLLSRWNPPVTALMIYRGFTGGSLAKPLAFIPLRQIPKIDLGAIRDAYRVNKAIGYVYAGASTIPQQLARTLFLSPRKTYFRKYVEALISIEMDFFLSKDRILELYLNYIEWGSGVFGIGAASSFYYQTKPAHLTLDEQRRLAAILTNPLRYNVSTFTKSRQMAGRYQYLLDKFPDPVPESGQAAQPGQEGQPGQETGQAQPEGAAAPPQNAPGIQRDGTPAPRG